MCAMEPLRPKLIDVYELNIFIDNVDHKRAMEWAKDLWVQVDGINQNGPDLM